MRTLLYIMVIIGVAVNGYILYGSRPDPCDTQEMTKLRTEISTLKGLDKIRVEGDKSIHDLMMDEIGKLKIKQAKDSASHRINLDKYESLMKRFLKLEKSFKDEMDKKDRVIEL